MEEKVFCFKPEDMTICLSDCISPLTAIEAVLQDDQVKLNFFYSIVGKSTSRTFDSEDFSSLRQAFGFYLASTDCDDLKLKKLDSHHHKKLLKKRNFFKEDLGSGYVSIKFDFELFIVTNNTEIKRLYKFLVRVEKALRANTAKPQHTLSA